MNNEPEGPEEHDDERSLYRADADAVPEAVHDDAATLPECRNAPDHVLHCDSPDSVVGEDGNFPPLAE